MSDNDPNAAPAPTRRSFFRHIGVIPIAAVALPGCSDHAGETAAGGSSATAADQQQQQHPRFFNDVELAFLHAACDRLIPSDEVGPGAIEAGVIEFLDRHMNTPYAAGDIWYMQGPFLEAAPQFGYQGRLAVRDILRVGIKAMDAHCAKAFGGKRFADLEHAQQEELLKGAESGKLKLDDISAKVFFDQLLTETRSGYFSDPIHGGNKDMAAWKMIGYPGMRADYIDWVGVRDKPYPLPPVALSGKRG